MSSFVIVHVRSVRSREVIYHEVFDATQMSPAEYSVYLNARYRKLTLRFLAERYLGSATSFSSLLAMPPSSGPADRRSWMSAYVAA